MSARPRPRLSPLLRTALPLLGVATLAGCGSGGSAKVAASSIPVPPPAASSAPASPSPSATQTSAAPAPTTPAPAVATNAAPTQCTTTALAATIDAVQGAAGHLLATLTLRNTGTTACTLYGYAGMEFLTAGTADPTTVNRDPSVAPHTVLLAPQQRTSFSASAQNVPQGGGGCLTPPPDQLLLTPPGETSSLTLSTLGLRGGRWAPCAAIVSLRPVGSGALA